MKAPADAGFSPVDSWIRLLRPKQWIKNAFVLAPLLFSAQATRRSTLTSAALAFAAFCLAASAVYAFNDVRDRVEDQAHPTKRFRPVAAGLISVGTAHAASLLLACASTLLAWFVDSSVAGWIGVYLVLNVLYSTKLKSMVLLDVFSIASFFVLRLLAGSAAAMVVPSIWLLVCGGLLALYLGFAKRRHEITLLKGDAAAHRSVLAEYNVPLLDQICSVLLAVTMVAYLMFTQTSETGRRVGGDALGYSTIFVLYGALRYAYLVQVGNRGDPTDTVLEDRHLVVTVVAWTAYCGWLIYRPR